MYQRFTYQKIHFLTAVFLLPIALLIVFNSSITLAGIQVQNRYDQMSNSQTGAVATHMIGFTLTNTTTPVGSVLIQFCDNSPLIGDVCNFPVGMRVSTATLSSQTGNTGFTLSSNAGGQLLLTRNPSLPTSAPNTYYFDNITNPSSPGEYFARIQTFSSNDATGPYIEQGGIAFSIVSAFTVSSIVPPYLTFCGGIVVTNLNCGSAVGNQINFGNFSNAATSDGTSQFVVATNAQNGYNVSINGNTMTSGNFTIPNLKVPTKSIVGTSQFGVNIVANSYPAVGKDKIGIGTTTPTAAYNIPNYYTFNDGDIVVSSPTASDYNEFTASYLVNVGPDQAEGTYTTTLYYICLANF
jgi:hypothetical protein